MGKQNKNLNFFEKKEGFSLGEKSFSSDTDTESGPWFRFPIPKPGFGRTPCHHRLRLAAAGAAVLGCCEDQ